MMRKIIIDKLKGVLCYLVTAMIMGGLVNTVYAGPFIVEDGVPRAEIVIAEEPPRMVELASTELRDYIEKITGAQLPIVTELSDEFATKLYVGKSAYTEEIGVNDDGLQHSAFRMKSGPDYLVLLGHDADFAPGKPWPRNHGDRTRAQEEWEEITGGTWRNPMGSAFRTLHRESGIWASDEGGSLQAVYEFLRSLGVRWYMPGELGEVVPQQDSIPLPRFDRTVKPDYLYHNLRLGNVPHFPWDDFIWAFRLGLNNRDVAGSHGMRLIQSSQQMKEEHPEYYALYGGKRITGFRGSGHSCFSSEGLLQEAIDFARAAFDQFDLTGVSIFPQDGYRHCECEDCYDKTASEVVWEFVNNVAKEVYKTHPDRLVLGGAYTAYQNPPDSIDKFSPNVVVRISWVRPGLDDPESWEAYWDLVERWAEKLAPKRLMRNANVQWSASPDFPIIFPRSIAQELGAMKGLSLGEASSVPRSRDQRWLHPGLSHLNMYVMSRYFWNADQDLDALLDEYYTKFYGPAADAMRSAFEFAEASYSRKRKPSPSLVPIEKRIELVKLVQEARRIAGENVYGERIQSILDELTPLEEHEEALKERKEMGEPRKDAKVAWAGDAERGITAPTYRLRDMETGEKVDIETTFQVEWQGDALVFDIYCQEPDIDNMPITRNVWGGDSVAILLETPYHAYYHIEINPDGDLYDADRQYGRTRTMDNWSSLAEIETERGEDYWRLKVRIPVVPEEEGQSDPLHFVVGEKPTEEEPWFFNIGRTRGLDQQRERFGFLPNDRGIFHVPGAFGRLQVKEDDL